MPLSQRRPTNLLLSLALPHPPLPSTQSSIQPVTPIKNQHRDSLPAPSHRFSQDSASTGDSSFTMSVHEYEWSPNQIQVLTSILENLPDHLFTPYVGSVPPQNILQKLARGVKDAKGPQDWPHSLKATRQMLHTLASQMAVPKDKALPAPPAPERLPLYRQNSMDELLKREDDAIAKENSQIGRASSRLQRADRFFTFHPYPSRPRDSIVSNTSDPTGNGDHRPHAGEAFSSTAPRRPLRRTASSTSSQLQTVKEGKRLKEDDVLPLPARFARPMSLDEAPDVLMGGVKLPLKRLPSYGVVKQQAKEQAKGDAMVTPTNGSVPMITPTNVNPPPLLAVPGRKSPGVYSSDEEEKRREKAIKRMRPLTRKPSFLGGELPSTRVEPRKEREVKPQPKPSTTRTIPSSRRGDPRRGESPPTSRRSETLPSTRHQPQTITVVSVTSMSSMDSLPSLSASSSVTALSAEGSSSSSARKMVRTAKVRVTPVKSHHLRPSSPMSISTSSSSSSGGKIRATTLSPPASQRTLRRVGKQPLLKLEPLITSGLVSPPPARPGRKLGGIGRKISFGSMDSGEGSRATKRPIPAALGLNSPFEERAQPVVAGVKRTSGREKKATGSGLKYLF